MASFEQTDNGIFSPKIGDEYQAEIPSMIEESYQLSLQMNPAGSEDVHENLNSFEICFPNSITWSDADTKTFLLGLFIFGKNFIQIKSFIENKGMGEILPFYYGKFYKSDAYSRWSKCRKLKGRKRMIGENLFSGLRHQELLSRLTPHVSEESRHTLLQISKSYVEGKTSLEEYISYLKSTVGLSILVEAVGIGKEKGDLTRFAVEPGKNRRVISAPTSNDLSSLGPSDIIQSLTGGFRLSKTKSNELFWEAVWPRLLARGWHSEQPKYRGYVTSKDYLVFLTPGVEKFSRRKLVKGDHYFDSVSDVLSKVVAEPNILELEEEATKVGSSNEGDPEKGSNEDDSSDDNRQRYLMPRSSNYNKDHIKLMVIDTSLVHGGKPSDLMELKSLPVNSVCKVEVDDAGKKYKGQKYTRKVNHKQKSSKLTVIDTNRLSDGKSLKVKPPRYLPVESEDASMTITSLLRESKLGSLTNDSPRMMEAKTCGKSKINKTKGHQGVSDSGLYCKKETYDNLDNDAHKMIESQKNQGSCAFDQNRQKLIIRLPLNQKVGQGDSNHAAVPVKRRRLTACAKAEKSRIIENSSGGLGSDKLGLSWSSSFRDANKNVCAPVSHQQNESSTGSSADRSMEDANEKSILKDSFPCTSASRVRVEKCQSFTFNVPQVPSKSENRKMLKMARVGEEGLKPIDPCLISATQEAVEEPRKTSCDDGSLKQQPDINPRRQSTRVRPMTVRALECIENELLHEEKRHKKKDIQTHKYPFNPCRKARTKGKTTLRRQCSDQ